MVLRSRGHLNTLSSESGTVFEISASSCPKFSPLPTPPPCQPGQVGVLGSFYRTPLSPYRGGAAWRGRYYVSSNELAARGGNLHVQLPRGP